MSRVVCSAFLLIFSLGMTLPAKAAEPDGPEELITRNDAIGIQIQRQLSAKFRRTTEAHKKDHGGLVQFYEERGNKPVWVDENGLNDKAHQVITEIGKSDEFGLDAASYKFPNPEGLSSHKGVPAEWLAHTELKMSFTVLEFARHATSGRIDPSRLSKYLDRTKSLPDPVKIMSDLAESGEPANYINGLHPNHPQFRRLKKVLAGLRAGPRQRKQIHIPDGPNLRLGDQHPHIALIRERLKVPVSADLEDLEDAESFFDDELEKAVKAYQKSKGRNADGIIGPSTRRALNKRPRNRLQTILANMERWRWLPRNLGKMHIRVNVPEFRFRVIKNGKITHSERVVVGKTENQTPIFSDQMETVVFNPYWYPPVSIVNKEIIPGAQRSSSFISRHRFQVTTASGRRIDPHSVDWYSMRAGQVFIRQPPGSGNVLGVVKFLFPNKHQVYMHDTPTKHLFKQNVRAFSHGCMRVRNPVRLAELVLANEGWTPRRIGQAIATGENQHVPLKRKIPVHVTYFTAEVSEDGTLKFHNDIYGHDPRIAAALQGKYVPYQAGPSSAPPATTPIRRNRDYDANSSFLDRIFQF